MNTLPLIFLLVSEFIITSLTIYFFVKVLKSGKKNKNKSINE